MTAILIFVLWFVNAQATPQAGRTLQGVTRQTVRSDRAIRLPCSDADRERYPQLCAAAGLATDRAGTISGIVLRADTRQPMQGVRVELVPEEYPETPDSYSKPCRTRTASSELDARYVVQTNSKGEFSFNEN